MKIVFMGTPQFAVPSLRALIDSRHDVEAVFTQPDKPAGRRRRLRPTPVKQLAASARLSVSEPPEPCATGWVDKLEQIGPDLIVVVA